MYLLQPVRFPQANGFCQVLARALHPCQDARPLQGCLQGPCEALCRDAWPRIGMGWRWGEPHGNSGDNTNLLSHRFCCQLIPLLEANSIASFSSHCIALETIDLRNCIMLSTQRIYDTTFAQRIYDTTFAYSATLRSSLACICFEAYCCAANLLVAASEISTSKI